jgi:hypothetical protein
MERLRQTTPRRDAAPLLGGRVSEHPSPIATGPESGATAEVHGAAWLQRTAGNRAVAELFEAPRTPAAPPAVAQRDTPPGPPGPPAPTVAERLATADSSLKSGTLDDPIWTTFQANGGTANAIADRIWQGPLALSDVQPPARSRTDPAVKLRAALVSAVNRVVTAKLNELIKKATGKDDADKVKADVTRLTGIGASWDAGDVANQLWREWVGPASIVANSAGGGTPVRLYEALKSAAGKHAGTLRKEAFGEDGLKSLPAAEITAVETLLKPRPQWIRDAAGFDAFTDEVHRARGGSGKRDDATWKELNGRIPKLVVVAEANIVNAMKIANRPVTAALWAEFRGRFIASISKTIWRYHEENIVDASVFGTPIKKANVGQGFHRDVAEAIKLVEKSALRLSGKSTIAELKSAEGAQGKDTGARKNPITLPGTEFRFEPVSHEGWMREHGKLSPHGTGRAVDFRASTNPAVSGGAYEVVHLLTSPIGDTQGLDKSSIDWGKLRRQAGAVAPLMHQRAGLEELAKTETDPIAQDVIKSSLAVVDEAIRQQVVESPASKELRKDAEAALDKLNSINTSFQTAWQTFAGEKDDKELLAALLAHAETAKTDAQTKLTALLAAEAKARADKEAADKAAGGGTLTPPGTQAPTPAPTPAPAGTGSPKPKAGAKPPAKPPAPKPPPKSAEVLALEAAIARIDKLRPLLTVSATAKSISSGQKEMVKALRGAGELGLTDMPLWLVQAFIEQGWTWGGSWGGFLDAMHFDYLGPVADVI